MLITRLERVAICTFQFKSWGLPGDPLIFCLRGAAVFIDTARRAVLQKSLGRT